MEDLRITLARPIRWGSARVGAFMMGIGMGGGLKGLVRDFFDPEVRKQLRDNRSIDKRDKEMSRQICATTNPAARAMLVQMLIAMQDDELPKPSSFALRSAIGRNHEQVNDTRIDALTPGQARNIYERTSRRMSFMRACIGTGTPYTEYIVEHREAVEVYIRTSGVTVEELLETLQAIGSKLRPEYDY